MPRLAQGIRFMGFVLLPMAASLIMLRTPLVKLAFERGAFDSKATEATAYAMAFYGIGVLGLSLGDLASKAFYSLHDTITPTVVGAVSVAINVALNLALVRQLGHGGLALANSCAVTFGAVALLWYLRSKVGPARGKAVIHYTTGIGIASAIMVGPLAATKGLSRLAFLEVGGLLQAGRLALAFALGALVYGGASLLLKVPEAYAVLGAARRLTSRRWAGRQDHTGCRAG
ncbi:MAG: lipid II flippase MurJ [Bacillota bacterium]